MKLAIVGASARSACHSALRDGFDVVTVDQFADRDLADVCDVATLEDWERDLLNWLRRSDADAWMYVGGMENRQELVEELSECKPLLGTSASALRFIRDPIWLADHCERWGVAMPETRTSLPPQRQEDRWLRKPTASGGGLGIGPIESGSADRPDVIYQRRLAQKKCWSAVFCVSSKSAQLIGITQQLVGEPWLHGPRFGYCGSLATSAEDFATQRTSVDRIGDMLHSVHLRGLVGVDLVEDNHGSWLVEVNPRYTASVELIESLTGTSAIARHVAACVEATTHPAAIVPPRCFGKVILFADREFQLSTKFSDWAFQRRLDDGGWLADIPMPGTRVDRGDPILTLFARERENPLSQLRELTELVKNSLDTLCC